MLPQNNIKRMQTTVNKTLLEMKKKNSLSREEYEKLYCSTAVTPSLYGLIKLRKVGYPNSTNSFVLRLSNLRDIKISLKNSNTLDQPI